MQVILTMSDPKLSTRFRRGASRAASGLLVFLAAIGIGLTSAVAKAGQSVSIDRNQRSEAPKTTPLTGDSLWARATLPGRQMTAIYGQLVSRSLSIRVTGMRSNLSKAIELHETTMIDGKMRMSQIDWPSLEPGKPLLLKPGGTHLMVFGLEHPLTEGDELLLDIEVESGEIYSIPVQVQSPQSLEFESKQ
jgi:copper(I)-binding protein